MICTKKLLKLLKYNTPGLLSAGIWLAIAKTAANESLIGGTLIVIGVAIGLLALGCSIGSYLFWRSELRPTVSSDEVENLAAENLTIDMESYTSEAFQPHAIESRF